MPGKQDNKINIRLKFRVYFLIPLIILASFTLIAVNYYTIKILSAARAYINGESEYSKGQKDALLYLSTYIQTRDESYWMLFNESLQAPIGDNLARHSLVGGKPMDTVSHYFVMGKNNMKDIGDMIWLFKTFQGTLMKRPIQLWTEAEPLINDLSSTGIFIHEKIQADHLDEQQVNYLLKKMTYVSTNLYKKESEFSWVLGETVRSIDTYLLLSNIACILIILGSIGAYAVMMVKRLREFNGILESKNKELNKTNKDLDTLVYTVSHDLRSPLNSMQGLIGVSKMEKDPNVLSEYLNILESIIGQLDKFIIEIFDFYKNKHSVLAYKNFSLTNLIDGIISGNWYATKAQEILIEKELKEDEVYSEELLVKIILNNLISNAIKYSDDRKQEKKIWIRSRRQKNEVVIEVEDNGIGIDTMHLANLFDMFFVASATESGTGLGLYILKQNVDKLKGRVEVESEIKHGTTFRVFIPVMDFKKPEKLFRKAG